MLGQAEQRAGSEAAGRLSLVLLQASRHTELLPELALRPWPRRPIRQLGFSFAVHDWDGVPAAVELEQPAEQATMYYVNSVEVFECWCVIETTKL